MFKNVKNKIFGARYLLVALLGCFRNSFYAVADDQACPPAWRYGREDGSLIHEGNLSTGAMKNMVAVIDYPFNDAICGRKKTVQAYGRTTPVGDAIYGALPIGSEFTLLTIAATEVTAASKWLKVATGSTSAAWQKIVTSATATSHIIIAAGTVATVGGSVTETISITGITVTDIPFVNICSVGTVGGSVLGANCTASAGAITVTMSADQKVSTKLAYQVLRAVNS